MRTDATRVCRNAVAVATRPVPGRRAASRRQPAGRPRKRTGVALTAAGLVLALAVHVRAAPVNPQVAGLVLVGAGLAWLWAPVRDKAALLQRHFHAAIRYLSWDAGQPADRCSLTELLTDAPARSAGPTGKGAGRAGRQQPG